MYPGYKNILDHPMGFFLYRESTVMSKERSTQDLYVRIFSVISTLDGIQNVCYSPSHAIPYTPSVSDIPAHILLFREKRSGYPLSKDMLGAYTVVSDI